MGAMAAKKVTLDGQPVEVQPGESKDQFLGRHGLMNRQLTKIDGRSEKPVESLAEIRDGDQLGTAAQSELG
jgi:hypothetical protein